MKRGRSEEDTSRECTLGRGGEDAADALLPLAPPPPPSPPTPASPPSSPPPRLHADADVSASLPPPDHIIKMEIEEADEYDEKFIITRSQLDGLMENVNCKKRNCKGKVRVQVERDRWDSTFSVECTKC